MSRGGGEGGGGGGSVSHASSEQPYWSSSDGDVATTVRLHGYGQKPYFTVQEETYTDSVNYKLIHSKGEGGIIVIIETEPLLLLDLHT